MSVADRIFSGLKTVVLIEERVSRPGSSVDALKDATESKLANHETRLTRIETLIEIARPDGSGLRIAAPGEASDTDHSSGGEAGRRCRVAAWNWKSPGGTSVEVRISMAHVAARLERTLSRGSIAWPYEWHSNRIARLRQLAAGK
jgi:hypothetical protein